MRIRRENQMMKRSLLAFVLATSTLALALHSPTITIQPIDFMNEHAIYSTGSGKVVIPCQTTGSGNITYAWRHNGNPIQLDDRIKILDGNLSVANITASDDGKYICLASNLYGTSISREVTLQVSVVHSLRNISENIIQSSYGSARLRCQISNQTTRMPKPSQIYWTASDDSRVPETTSIAINEYDGDLIFIAGWQNNTGSYKCNVIFKLFDPTTGSSTKIKLTGAAQHVYFKIPTSATPSFAPKIEEGPTDIIAILGQVRVILECISTGYPIPTILWQKKLGPLPNNRYSIEKFGRHLVLKYIQEADAGEYQCIAFSGFKQVSASAKLRVAIDSRWKASITNTNQPIGSDFIWPCSVSGFDIKYKWYRNGQRISGSPQYNLHANGSLTIRHLSPSDAAVYSCQGYNNHSNIVSSGYLNVIVAAPTFIKSPYTQATFFRGQNATLRCTVTGGPRPTVEYTKNGRTIDRQLHNKYTAQLNGNLIIHHVQDSDAGVYKCIASNRYGTAEVSGSAVIKIATTFTKSLTKTFVRRPQGFILSCQIQKDPSLNVVFYWQKEGKNITTQKAVLNVHGLTTTLTYSSSSLGDSGRFSCFVATHVPFAGYETQSSSAMLTVHDIPDSPSDFRYNQVNASSAVLSWLPGNSNNSPLLRYGLTYRVNSNRLSNDPWRVAINDVPPWATFHRVNLSPYNYYHFKLIAINGVGSSKITPSLTFHTDVDIPYHSPGEFRASSGTADGAIIEIRYKPLSRDEMNGPHIYNLLEFKPQAISSSWSFINIGNNGSYRLTGVLENTVYKLRLRPFNDIGLGKEWTHTVTVKTGVAAPTLIPEHFQVYVIGNDSVKLVWSTDALGNSMGTKIIGYRICTFEIIEYVHITVLNSNSDELAIISYWTYDQSIAKTQTLGDVNVATMNHLKHNFSYHFRINAFNCGGDGLLSQTVSQYISRSVPEHHPVFTDSISNFTSSQMLSHQLILQWLAPAITNGIIQSYQINYKLIGNQSNSRKTIAKNTTGNETSAILNNMKLGIYQFTIAARNIHGYGVPVTIRHKVANILAPIRLAATAIERTFIHLSWTVGDIIGQEETQCLDDKF
ncbi:uncharacterized protein TRIADDRAFT_62007 [Trichoplax adhaerens]|uniref:Uncharacterized protein n=1 Tax=Trichoplax adhaerens TaxID=10228 RepID=B3SCK7_TRIAD|nr:hypothetical protein TRIADDRAFT_62007 [Trichoplax adhaerens]EDV19554.1 hypothetical protein TRIADDRAFT_62007 [Trichoplax adhaerens]|eukprot:XP_002117986.1 hypothetical protein TRIADDRAFT_62007 [Trichoplax adhaerens]